MTNSQVAALVAVALGVGAGGRALVASVGGDGSTLTVQSVRAVLAREADGGSVLVVETCGVAKSAKGSAARWCDRRADPRMDGLVADSVKWLEEARQVGEKKHAALASQMVVRDAGH